jgi:hypothetical protein
VRVPRRATITVAFPFLLLPWVLRIRAFWFLLGWFALQIGKGTMDLMAHVNDPQVAWWAHATGFIAGLAGALAGRGWQQAPATLPAPSPPRTPPPRPLTPPLPRASLAPARRASRSSAVPARRTSLVPAAPSRVSLLPSAVRPSVP